MNKKERNRQIADKAKSGELDISNFPDIKGWKIPLYEFQQRGVLWMFGREKVILADGVGLGKTIQTLALVALRKQLPNVEHRTIVFVPNSQLQEQWRKEALDFSNLRCQVVTGTQKQRLSIYSKAKNWDILICRYSLLQRQDSPDVAALQKLGIKIVVCDEASAIRYHNTNTSKRIKLMTRNAESVILLDATPIQTTPLDIHSLIESFHDGTFGNRYQFENKYIQRRGGNIIRGSRFQGDVIGFKNMDDLKEKVAPHLLRRRKDDVAQDLPEVVSVRHYLDMGSRQAKLYQDARRGALEVIQQSREMTDAQRRVQVQTQFHHLQYIANSTIVSDDIASAQSAKLDWLIPNILSFGSDSKVVLFTRYKNIIPLLQNRLRASNIQSVVFSGDVPAEDRLTVLSEFKDNPQIRVLIGTSGH